MKAFTLPNGAGVLLRELGQSDWDILRKWAQKTYLADVNSAIADLSEQVQYALVREAVEIVTSATFNLGLCLEILFGSPVGLARVIYQMIQSPGLSFDEFFMMVFPKSLYMRDGIQAYTEGYIVLNKICETVYGASIDKVFWSNDVLVNNETENIEETEQTEESKEPETSENIETSEETETAEETETNKESEQAAETETSDESEEKEETSGE